MIQMALIQTTILTMAVLKSSFTLTEISVVNKDHVVAMLMLMLPPPPLLLLLLVVVLLL